MFHRHNQGTGRVKVTGRVLARELLPGPRAPHPKLLTVELYLEGGAPIKAEVRVIPGHRNHWDDDLYFNVPGDRTGFLYDPDSGETWFDMTDPRNHMSSHVAAGDALANAPDDDTPLAVDSGPPWLVLPTCPFCHRKVNLPQAAMEPEPHCMSCAQVLPAYPLVTSELRRQSLS